MTKSLAMHPHFDELTISLAKLNALLKIVSSADIISLEPETLFHYFCMASDVLDKAENACEKLGRIPVFFD